MWAAAWGECVQAFSEAREPWCVSTPRRSRGAPGRPRRIQAGGRFEGGAWHLELGGRASPALDREIARGIGLATLLAKGA